MEFNIKQMFACSKDACISFFTYKDFKRIKKSDCSKKTDYLVKRKIDLCDMINMEGNGIIAKNNKRYLFFKFYVLDAQNKGISDELVEKERHCLTEFFDDMQLDYRIFGIKEKENDLKENLEYYEMLLAKGGWTPFQEEVIRESIDKIAFHNNRVKCVKIMMIEESAKDILLNYDSQIEFEMIYGDALISFLKSLNNDWWC